MAFEVALAEEIWTAKYRFKPSDGEGDASFAQTADRVARAVAEAEPPEQREHWQGRFRDARPTGAGRLQGRLTDGDDGGVAGPTGHPTVSTIPFN